MRRWGEARDIGEAVAALAAGAHGLCDRLGLNLDGGLSVPQAVKVVRP